MKQHGQYCPVALGSEVIGDRWTPLILREMVLGSTRFNDIERGLPGISRTLLQQRLRHLERKGVVATRPAKAGRGNEYHLTDAGRDLEPVIMALGEWTARWIFTEPEPAEVDARTLTWWMHRRVQAAELPDRRVTVEFNYTGDDRLQIWLVLDRGEPSVCIKHPGFETDVLVTADALTMLKVFNGWMSLGDAIADGTVQLAGPPALTRRFARWFLWSPFSSTVRETLASR